MGSSTELRESLRWNNAIDTVKVSAQYNDKVSKFNAINLLT